MWLSATLLLYALHSDEIVSVLTMLTVFQVLAHMDMQYHNGAVYTQEAAIHEP